MSVQEPWQQSDSLRQREFYKYYDPVRALTKNEPPSNIIDLSDTANCPKPRSSPDRALTAFCQLGALRLGTQRCMLFFFDTDHAYVLAEATRTLSLLDDDVYENQDGLWLGYTIIPRGLTVCEHTINKPPIDLAEGHSVYIINDLGEDVNFCNRPYVSDGPKARFYAGVPITTPSNVRIGAYCVLDDKPRNGLNSSEVEFMQHMSETVMGHLEMIRSRAELEMGANMLTGLGDLVRNSSHTSDPTVPLIAAKGTSPVVSQASLEKNMASGAEAARPSNASLKAPSDTPPTGVDSRHVSRGVEATREDVQAAFQAATAVLRTAMEVDGVISLDASINIYGGAVQSNPHGARGESDFNVTGATNVMKDTNSCQESDDVPSKILGVSESLENGQARNLNMSERFLKTLLDQYPRGKVWAFEDDDSFHSDYAMPASEEPDLSWLNDSRFRADRSANKSAEGQELQRLFPGARGLCLVGMWDGIRDRWFGGTLVWTYSHSRVMTSNTELVFLIAFNEVLMAEVTRLESRLESKAKSDFISSISHELRSPLQGILCGIDLLSEQKSADLPILSQIETCSTTLLEVINHLLDFAKISPRNRDKAESDPLGRRNSFLHPEVMAKNIPEIPIVTHSYGKITEEVCDSMFYSHIYNQERHSATKVDLILDMHVDANVQHSADVGAWKRICINIINNALKYTDEGYVAVSLRKGSRKDGHPLIVLSVVDTGRGMSSEFLNNRLFRPFEQENDLTQGTGLGMSIVIKLVDSLGGNIEVQSLKNCGTTITISVPLDDSVQAPNGIDIHPPFEGLQIGLVESSQPDLHSSGLGRKLLLATLERSCQRLGADVTSSDSCDVDMVFESDLQLLDQRKSAPSTIILCDSFASAHQLRKSIELQSGNGHVECIAQPYGPLRLAGAIQGCIQAVKDRPSIGQDPDMLNGNTDLSSVSHRSASGLVQQLDDMNAAATMDRAIPSPADMPRAFDLEDPTSASCSDPYASPIVKTSDEKPSDNYFSIRSKTGDDQISAFSSNGNSRTPANMSVIRLLLVDDNSINLRMLVTYADKNGYQRMTAANGREAVEAYENATRPAADAYATTALTSHTAIPIVILLDINMPVMDGFEAARRIREYERSHDIPPATIIAVTGLGSAEARQKARASGMDLFLTKPVRPREFTSILAPIVDTCSPQAVRGVG